MILLFKYNDKVLKFFPRDETIDLITYANSTLPKDTPYKIVSSIDNLNSNELMELLNSPDGFSNNNLF